MRAFVVSKYKGPLQEADVPEPVVGERDVLVQVQAAGLNALDEKIRSGAFKSFLRYELPQVMGNDVAGTVIGVGAEVRGFALGDQVYARPDKDRIGTFAERIAIAEADLALKPATITIEEAASLPLVALTAWQALVEKGNVRPGQRVLIHAGAGGVGSVAIQLAKHLGATVATTVSAGNVDFVRKLGADSVIDYRNQDFERLLDGYDLVLDSLGGTNLEKSLRVLRPGGKAIGIAGPPDPAFAERGRNESGTACRDRGAQQQDPPAGEEARCDVRVPLHARQRRPAPSDHCPRRQRRTASGRRTRLRLRPDRGRGAVARQGRHPRQGRHHPGLKAHLTNRKTRVRRAS